MSFSIAINRMESFNIASLPLPTEKKEEDQEYLSVIFSKLQQCEVLSVSKESMTPFWMNRKNYTKLNVDIVFKQEPVDTKKL